MLRGKLVDVKWIASERALELTARNIAALTEKLDDPLSARTLASPCGQIMARAVEEPENSDRLVAAAAIEGVLLLTRTDLASLAALGAVVTISDVTVTAVTDAQHYEHRSPGLVYMPTSGEYR